MSGAGPARCFVDLDNTLHDYDRAADIALAAWSAWMGEQLRAPADAVLERYRATVDIYNGTDRGSGADVRRRRVELVASSYGDRAAHEIDAMTARLLHDLLSACSAYGGVIDALDRLSAMMPVDILTDGFGDTQRAMCEAIGIDLQRFPLWCTRDYGLRKYDGSVYRMLNEHPGNTGRRLLMCGDNWEADIAAAAEAGWYTVWIDRGRPLPERPVKFIGSGEDFCACADIIAEWSR